jgi:hypothetical protein
MVNIENLDSELVDLCHWALARSYRDNIQGCLIKKEGGRLS